MSDISNHVTGRLQTLGTWLTKATSVWPVTRHAHWLLRLPIAAVMLQYGLDKVPLSADAAAGWGLPFWAWALAGVGELAVAFLLIASGLLAPFVGDKVAALLTRLTGLAAAIIVAGVIVVAYWAPPLDLLMFNQFHILLLGASLYIAFGPQTRSS